MFSLFSKETVLYAPINGKIIRIEDVPDQVFASKMMGEGVGFVNDGNEIYAPCDAKVIMVPSSKHAIGLKTKKGIELLIHIGLDTVNLNGEGFQVHVKENDSVKRGQLLISYDKHLMEKKKINLITPLVITNSSEYIIEKLVEESQIGINDKVLIVK